jgi:rhamnopyranosyl-N-acetylglucosaminyl-diphospho-decaprenol beta-1,3/1,4-galactofuranosyltransferase
MAMRITAVVVTYSRPDLLPKVVEALREQTRPVDRIVIVNNAGNSKAEAGLPRMDNLVMLHSKVNLGGAGGFALGMQEACRLGTDWIWLLDDDAIPRIEALAALVNALADLPRPVGGVCGTVHEYGDVATMHRRMFGALLGLERPLARTAYSTTAISIDTGSFVGFMVSAAAIAVVGFPNPAFFLAYDDTEYSLRLKAAGFGLWLIPASVVDHMRTAESRLRYSDFGPKHYFNIRNRIAVKRAYSYFHNLSVLSGIFFGCALWIVCRGRFRRRTFRVLVRAISDGFKGRLGPYPEIESSPVS